MYEGAIAEVEGVEMEIALAIACFLIGYLLARVWKLGERVAKLEADLTVIGVQVEFLVKWKNRIQMDEITRECAGGITVEKDTKQEEKQ